MTPHGSFVLNVGGSWTPGAPVRSLYHFRLLLALCDELGFELCQEFFWYNPAKMPAPAEWVNVRRIRVKDSVEYIFWLSPSKYPSADNSRVLQAYSKDMERLIKRGIKQTKRPSGHNITPKFSQDRGGSIPANVIQCGNNESNSEYIKLSKKLGKKIHPGTIPGRIAAVLHRVLDRTGRRGSRPVRWIEHHGAVAEQLGRKWIAVEKNRTYAKDSELRFQCRKTATVSAKGQPLLFEVSVTRS